MDITVDQQHASDQMRRFSQTMRWYCDTLGIAWGDTVKRHGGLLARTLVNLTPPMRKQSTYDKIKKRVDRLTTAEPTAVRSYSTEDDPTKSGKGAISWYSFSSTKVYGVARDLDYRNRSQSDLLSMYKYISDKANARGTIQVGQRGKQTFRLIQKILAKREQIATMFRRLVGRIGRLKAAWVVSWQDCGAPGGSPPQWIMNHVAGSRAMRMGWSIDATKMPGLPTLTIGNRAAGAGNILKNSGEIVRRALKMRTDAMVKDVQFAIQHPKEWQQREAQAKLSVTISELDPL